MDETYEVCKPHMYELLTILDEYTIEKKVLPIKDGMYNNGFIIPEDSYMALNASNMPNSDLETISHELVHHYCDYIKRNFLPEQEIEQISRQYLQDDYYKENLVDKLKELY